MLKPTQAPCGESQEAAEVSSGIKSTLRNLRRLAVVMPFAALSNSSIHTLLLVTRTVSSFIKLYLLLLFLRVLLSWFPTFNWESQPWLALRQVRCRMPAHPVSCRSARFQSRFPLCGRSRLLPGPVRSCVVHLLFPMHLDPCTDLLIIRSATALAGLWSKCLGSASDEKQCVSNERSSVCAKITHLLIFSLRLSRVTLPLLSVVSAVADTAPVRQRCCCRVPQQCVNLTFSSSSSSSEGGP